MANKYEYLPSPLYEQWLESSNKESFIESLDEMAKGVLFCGTVYQYYREQEYPPIEEFFDAISKHDIEAMEDYRQKCLAVKVKYPKLI